MLKSTLVQRLTDKLHDISVADIECAVTLLIQSIAATFSEPDGRIEIRDFCSISLRYCAPRSAHNPKTGLRFVTQPTYRPHFKMGKALRLRINQVKVSP